MGKEFYKKKEEIEGWLNKYNIRNYTLQQNKKYGFVVDVNDVVIIKEKDLDWIPIKFNRVNMSFYCYSNKLTSLEFCPKYVGGDFDCSSNQLTSLKHCPKKIEGSFYCDHNHIIDLEFFPQQINGKLTILRNNPSLLELQDISMFGALFEKHIKIKNKKNLHKKINVLIDDGKIDNIGNVKKNKI